MDQRLALPTVDAPLDDEAKLILERALELEAHFETKDVGDADTARKFDAARRRMFLAHFAQFGRVFHAAQLVGICAETVNNAKRTDPGFRQAFEEAENISKELLVKEGRHRAMHGDLEVVVSGGQVVYIDVLDENGDPVFLRDPATNGIITHPKTGRPLTKQKPLLRRQKSDRLMELFLKAKLPEFKDKQEIDVNFKGGVLRVGAPVTREQWEEELRKLRESNAALALEEPQGTQTFLPGPNNQAVKKDIIK